MSTRSPISATATASPLGPLKLRKEITKAAVVKEIGMRFIIPVVVAFGLGCGKREERAPPSASGSAAGSADRASAGKRSAATTLKDPELRNELLALVEEDQAAREAWIDVNDTTASERVQAIDRKSTARMKEVVAKYGWPGTSIIGEDGANAAWLLVQHADADRPFQRQCLSLLEKAMQAGEASAMDYAYLSDRVATGDNRPQRYGTQFRDNKPLPIEDEAHVDERRKAVGLGTMAEYAARDACSLRIEVIVPAPVQHDEGPAIAG